MKISEIVVEISRKGLDPTELEFPVDAQVLHVTLQDAGFGDRELVITVAGESTVAYGAVKRRIVVLPPNGTTVLSSEQLIFCGVAEMERKRNSFSDSDKFFVFLEK